MSSNPPTSLLHWPPRSPTNSQNPYHIYPVAESHENMCSGTVLLGGYASGGGPGRSVWVKRCMEGPAAAVEGDTCRVESMVADGHVAEGTAHTARAHMSALASWFAVGETALGLACLPGFKPPAYGSLCLQCLCLTVPIHCSMFPGTRAETGSGACFCFETLLTPMHLAILGQVFWSEWKTSLFCKAQEPLANVIAAWRLYLTDQRAWRSRVESLLRGLSR